MTTDQNIKRVARDLAARTGQSYTRALWALRAEGETIPWPVLVPDQKVRFAEERTSYIVQAVSDDGRFVACTKQINLPQTPCSPGSSPDVLYTVIDMELGVRGKSTSWNTLFSTRKLCEKAIQDFVNTALPPDRRNPKVRAAEVCPGRWTWLRMHERQLDPLTAAQLDWLRQVLAVAPARGRNDRHPRSADEMAFRLTDGLPVSG